ncbi:hypothetical protein P0082_06590 [Candidatus Haliotispira prima]|uniref:Uncharacterized protein n=1 Tax=Candidatus Haliotispira prima TaxID=3034016 RepID=A0ABY8MDU4_9SPIO|nr:hypothetical protein P0082_06590 [Candidatus Haliotispira prima]
MMDRKETDSEKFLQGLLRVGKIEEDRGLSPAVRCALGYIPHQTVYQLPEPNVKLLSSEKVLLTRKANELFRLGQVRAAEKIYVTVGYSAGLYKLAEHYFQKHDFLRAYLLFQAANDFREADALAERFVAVVREWLKSSN